MQIGVPFQVLATAVDESVLPGETAADYVTRLARAKAWAGRRIGAGAPQPVLAADTTVVLDGRILGKPRDRADGMEMLLALAARTHEVLTAVAVAAAGGIEWRLCRREAHAYWETGEPHDKAGGYAVQGRAAVFITRLVGSYSGVMGLPLYETAELLLAAGIPRWR